MIGRTVAHYEIQGKLGAGAMGEVYLAVDTNLGRKVALKFLPESLSNDREARTRLLLEAQNASLLNHPNVVTIHAIEHVDGHDFIAMEFIEGQTLKDVLAAGLLPLDRIVEIGCAICEGLAAAHEHGIIHRDIKPDNIFITPRGHVKIADFGIARSEQGAGLTRTGMMPGTAYYMSPEQARGEKTLDARSDLFSAAAVVYEMATGRRPFEGEHLTAVLFELLSEDPPKATTLRPDLPPGFDDFITTALAKNAGARFQNAGEMATALRAMTGGEHATSGTGTSGLTATTRVSAPIPFSTRMKIGIALSLVSIIAVAVVGYFTFSNYFDFVKQAPADQRKMLAVLPFETRGTPEQESFADGLTEEVISKLSQVKGLGVISRTGVMPYKHTKKKPRQIAEDLAVEYLMEGSVRWAEDEKGHRFRVTVGLIAAREGTSLWSATYDTLMSDVLTVQAEIAQKVTGAMHITLLEADRQNFVRGGTKNPNALLAYYRGNSLFHSGRIDVDLPLAIASYQEAVRQDSTYVQAWARLSRAHAKMVWWGFDRNQKHRAQSKSAMEKAVRLDRDAPETQLASGDYYYRVEKNYPLALEQFRAIEQNAVRTGEVFKVYTSMAYVERRLGEFDKCVAHLQIALTQDPDLNVKDAVPQFAERAWELGNTLLRLRRWPEAERALQQALALDPTDARPYMYLARLQIYAYGNADSAIAILDRATEAVGLEALAEDRVLTYLLRRDAPRALKELMIVDDDTAFYNLQAAWIAHEMKDAVTERKFYDGARLILERWIDAEPDVASMHRYLGIAYAGIGRREDALREGRKALELVSPTRDAFFSGPANVEGMARIHVLLGNPEEAIELLDSLLSLPAGLITPAYLKIAPEYDPLRGNPRFELLISQGQPTASTVPTSRESSSLRASGSIMASNRILTIARN